MISFLTSLIPLITSIGTWLIDQMISDQDEAANAKAAFLAAIQAHVNDAIASANARSQYQNQLNELKKDAEKTDSTPQP